MKILFVIPLLVSSVLCSYLKGLDRSFEEADFKMVDLYFSLPEKEVNSLIEVVQIDRNQTALDNINNLEDYTYKKAGLVAKLNGNEYSFKDVTIKTGGRTSRSNDKVGFNFKLGKKFLGRKQLRLRPDAGDKSYMRTKISCDIGNRIGLPSLQSTYARLYVNNEYWGLYHLLDNIKPSWIKQTFKPEAEDITTLFECKEDGMHMTIGSESLCKNSNDDYPDMTALSKFLVQINEAKTIEEVEKVLDVDEFLKFVAMEWLIGSFDHLLVLGHNFSLYQRESDGKWVIIEYDYDNTFGSGLANAHYWCGIENGAGTIGLCDDDFETKVEAIQYFSTLDTKKFSFEEWEFNLPIIKTLVLDNPERFKKILREVLVSAFNPLILNEHIDQIKEFLLPYVEEDTTPDENGNFAGRINKKGSPKINTVEEFLITIEENTERRVVRDGIERVFLNQGIKPWIESKFENVCQQYNFDPEEILKEAANYIPKGYDFTNGYEPDIIDITKDSQLEDDSECWSEKLGYSCCKGCVVVLTDEDGQWGGEHGQWCGIKESVCEANLKNGNCYGAVTRHYPCCETCNVVLTDEEGKWGFENNHWCSISYSC